jgi:O-antigen/teichoic acid export membrane protein
MKRHLKNAAYGVLDYASFPFGMLLVAPLVLHRIGAAEYGLWMVSTAVVSVGGILASGFGDASIQRVARLRGTSDTPAMVRTVRSMLGIHLVLGSALAVLVWVAAPYAARQIAASHTVPATECMIALRIASLLILVRALESVGVSTQRAFEQYRSAVQISTAVRLLTLAAAAVLALFERRTISILAATAILMILGTTMQFRQARRLLQEAPLWPIFDSEATRSLLKSGAFIWLQALGGLLFTQFDRILLGLSLGAQAVASYALCVQFAQPLDGLTASGLNFLFPYLSGRAGAMSHGTLRSTLFKVLVCNVAAVGCGAGLLLLAGSWLMRIWAGAAVARSAATIFPFVVLGSAFTGLSVTGIYALQALGRFRTVALISLGSRAAMLPLMLYLLHHWGLEGLAVSRLCLGSVASLVYLPLRRLIATEIGRPSASVAGVPFVLEEGSQL